ncbi:MAG: hypothetical protein HYX34_13830 [Actinobacteria bacterium]|nr:hypothetical protein [Actinomycetota bacterium]
MPSGRAKGRKVKAGEGRALGLLRRTGFRKGVLGGSRGWTAAFVGVWGYRQLKRLAKREEEVVFRSELKPGERLVIANGRAAIDRQFPRSTKE